MLSAALRTSMSVVMAAAAVANRKRDCRRCIVDFSAKLDEARQTPPKKPDEGSL